MTLSNDRPRAPATLIERKAAIVDRVRQKYADKGAIPHRVYVRLFKWSGGKRHIGDQEQIEEVELTPPPELQAASSQRYQVLSGGTRAEGTVRLVGISPRYTEADLDLLIGQRDAADSVEIHMVPDGREGDDPLIKRYRPIGKPERDVVGFQWTLALELIDQKRASEMQGGR